MGGNDLLVGGSANDNLDDHDVTGDTDVLRGMGGNDSLDAPDVDALDSLDGGEGLDTCSSDWGDAVVGCD